MLIGIDARAASHPQFGGFKTYTEGLIEGLAAIDAHHDYRLFVDRPYAPPFAIGPNFSTEVVSGGRGMPAVGWREQVVLPLRSRHLSPDVLHFPCNTGPVWPSRPAVVTIHDLLTVQNKPRLPSTLARRAWRQFLITSYSTVTMTLPPQRFAAVITDSHYVGRQILNHYGLDERKLHVIPLAYSSHFRRLDPQAARAAIAQDFGLHDPYVMALGSADPRKNLHGVLTAYRLLSPELRARYRLVLVLNHDHLEERLEREIAAHDLRGKVAFVYRPSTPALACLYNAATAFVFPSFAEGFGLPALEALACGVPAVVSNTTSLPEVTGDAALLAPPDQPAAIAAQLAAVLDNPSLQSSLCERGLRRAQTFSWQRTARMTLDVYHQVVAQQETA